MTAMEKIMTMMSIRLDLLCNCVVIFFVCVGAC